MLDNCSMHLHDWMHGIFVGGVWNVTLYYYLEKLLQVGKKWELNIYMMFSDYISKWTWPSRIAASKYIHEVCKDERKDKHREVKKNQGTSI